MHSQAVRAFQVAARSAPRWKTARRQRSKVGPLPLGTVIEGHYELRRILGLGSSGVVYLARDLELERDVAVKVLNRRRAQDSVGTRAFREEARAMASVFHRNVVQIYAYGVYDSLPYFAMEYLPNGTVAGYLEDSLRRGEPLYLDVVLGIVRQVADALQAVHDQGIVHRDVKPANMLIGPGFRVALADFGLVASLDVGSPTGTLAGTPMYLAPELIRDNEVPEHQLHLCDIYSLGVSTYELLCGTGPFDGESIREILGCHLSAMPTPVTDRRPDIPVAFDAVLARTMHKDPSQRYSSCRELALALQSARQAAFSHRYPRSSGRILVVDGDPHHRSELAAALGAGIPDAAVLSAADAAEALGLVRACRPDLVVLDMELPAVNGLELCASLNADEIFAGVPILALSPRPGATRAMLRLLGADEVLPKPVRLCELVRHVRRRLDVEGFCHGEICRLDLKG